LPREILSGSNVTPLLARLRRFIVVLSCFVPAVAGAQDDFRPFSKEQIDQLTAQVALFPDALLSQVLMAATYPADVAEAALWSRANPDEKGDAAVALVDDKPWDPSVQSLVAFPQVIVMMGENPTWVKDLGDAFLLQPEDVMDSVQRLRAAAQRAGNLASNEHVNVTVESRPPADFVQVVGAPPPPPQVIVIEQRNPQVVFVPMYNPVHVFGPWMWPAFPPVFIPPPPGFWWYRPISVGIWWGVGVGVTHAIWGRPHWWSRSVTINVHHHNRIHVRHPIDRWDPGRGDVNWSHRPDRRRDIPYRGGDRTRDQLQRRADRVDREQFRGRDVDRSRAEQALRDRGVSTDRDALRDRNRDDLRRQAQGLDPGRSRELDRGAARDRAQSIDRDAARERAQSIDRGATRDRAQSIDRDAARDRAQSIDRGATRDRVQGIDRDAARDRARDMDRGASRDQRVPALEGVDRRQARQEIDRGRASREAIQRPASTPAQRPTQRPRDAVAQPSQGQRPQVQRPSGAAQGNRPQGGSRSR
jgi:hypothetical protein